MSGDNVHEIVIIKRVSGGHEDEHHGGVWKIAFADFMTAMMAFFLVMWLISANDKTKAVIARYFNPVQLVDSTPQPRGLEDPKPSAPSVMPHSGKPKPEATEKDAKDEKAEAKPAAEAEKAEAAPEHGKAEAAKAEAAKEAAKAEKAAKEESKLFADPYAVLAELAGKDKVPPPHEGPKAVTEDKLGGTGAIGMKGGVAYRDPFEPLPLPAGRDDSAIAPPGDGDTLPPGQASAAKPDSPEHPAEAAADASAAPEAKAPGSPEGPPPPADGKAAAKPAALPGAPPASAEAKAGEGPKTAVASPAGLAALRAEVQALAKAEGAAAGHEPRIDVHLSEEGLLIDVTDVQDFAMFGNASAKPSPRTVVLMEKVGRLLKAQPGTIVVRGFTDNRPFRSDLYDNWRLSSARADMAHYMLVRGGVDERRFERIEGYADRRPVDPKDGAAPANRRIQVLVRNAKP